MGTNPPNNSDAVKKKEIPVSVEEWDGQQSALPLKNIPINAWSYLLNMDFRNPYLVTSRAGSQQYMGNSITGNVHILAGFEFKRSVDNHAKIVFLTSNGKLYDLDPTISFIPTFRANLTNPAPTKVSMVLLKDCLWIADGVAALKWDGTTLTDITSTFPSVAPGSLGNIVWSVTSKNRVWWATDTDWLIYSVVNDPDDLITTANGAGKLQISYAEGMKIMTMVPWGDTFVINKGDTTTYQFGMYWVRGIGSTADPFRIEALFGDSKNPTAFLGTSAVQIGSDMIGITNSGLAAVSAINNFKEADTDLISSNINDVIKRINLNVSYKITGVYDNMNKQYMCAVPLDGATNNTHIIVYDRLRDRWSLYDNWVVRCWLRVKDVILYGDQSGHFIKIGVGDNDQGAGYQKVAETGNNTFSYPDVVKLFKSVEVDINHEGDYPVSLQAIIDDYFQQSNTVNLELDNKSSLWDVFVWDEDYWDLSGNTVRTAYILGRGKTLRLRFYNDQPDQPYSLGQLTYRLVQKDAGSVKS